MGQRLAQARLLDALAGEAKTLAEAQALSARAAELRRRAGGGWFGSWQSRQLIRN